MALDLVHTPMDSKHMLCFAETLQVYLLFCFLFSREGHSYFKEWMNLFDWLGQLLILSIVPLRYCDSKSQWVVASLAFPVNCLRIFKFSCVTR